MIVSALPISTEIIAEHLTRVGYIVLPAPFQGTLSAQLLARCHDDNHGRFHAAQIGRGDARKQIGAIRGDVTSWLDGNDSVDHAYLAWMEELRTIFEKNQTATNQQVASFALPCAVKTFVSASHQFYCTHQIE